MGTGLAAQVQGAMARRRQLEEQRAAVAILLQRYNQAPTMCQWAHAVLRCDEVQPFKLLYVIAERGVSC